jgi:aspartyl protease
MSNFKVFASVVLATTIVSTLAAETRCPGNVASVPFHIVNRHQIIVAVSVNHTGPYNFLLDTGTQLTMVDPSLADQLHLATQGEAVVASVGTHASASYAQLDQLEAGSHSVANQKVLVYDLQNLQATGLNIQGVLGEDFLEQFDMLIDNAHGMLCLDDSNAMRAEVKGSRVALVDADQKTTSSTPSSLIVVAKLSDGMRPVRLKLDSGSNVPFLYNTSDYMALGLSHGASLHGGGANGAQRMFTALPPQDVKMGSVEVSKVPFITLAGVQKDTRTSDFDGLLTMGLFKRVFVDHADHFAVLEAW